MRTAPKKCPFRYDLIWVKSSSGFLNSKRMPLRSHELIYVFYEKLPFYDLSSHKNKFIDKEDSVEAKDGTYGKLKIKQPKTAGPRWDPPLPNSVLPKGAQIHSAQVKGENNIYGSSNGGNIGNIHGPNYEPPLPDSILKIKSTRGKHSTQKPVDLIKWILKYYSKEGDIVLDATMGSGSTGVACKEMKRDFIGIEMNPEIYEVAVNRIEP